MPFVSLDSKTHVNVGTIGHLDHGKTTLTAALVARQAHRNRLPTFRSYAEIAHGGTVRDENKIVTLRVGYAEYETPTWHYVHLDCPGFDSDFKNTLHAVARLDAAILVVAGTDGPMARTREYLLLARHMKAPRLVVFLSKVDAVADPVQLDFIEREIRELLSRYDFPGDDVPIVRGNALGALRTQGKEDGACRSIDELLSALDTSIPAPVRDEDGPFLLFIDDVFSREGRGTFAAGRIERGKCKVGDEVEIVGLRKEPRTTVITGVEMFQKTLDYGMAGDNVGVLLRGIERAGIERGQVLARPGSIKPHTKFEASIYVLRQDEGGRQVPFFTGYRAQFYFPMTDVTGSLALPDGVEFYMPGETVKITVELSPDVPIVLDEGLRFAMREGGRTVGVGVVTRVLD